MRATTQPPPVIERGLGLYKVLWLERYRRCGCEYVILQCEGCGRYEAVPVRCGIRLCESCSARRGRRIEERYLDVIESASSSSKIEKLSFLTLTIRNFWNLEIGFKRLKKAIRLFRLNKYVRRRLKGGIYAYEVSVDDSGWYHIHAHFIILHRWFGSPTRKEIRNLNIPKRLRSTKSNASKSDLINRKGSDTGQIMLSAIWENLTSDPVVDIRPVRSSKKGLRYVVKYVKKPPSFPSEENYVDFLRCFENKPLIVSFGKFRGVKGEIRRMICKWCGCRIFGFIGVVWGWELEEWIGGYDPP